MCGGGEEAGGREQVREPAAALRTEAAQLYVAARGEMQLTVPNRSAAARSASAWPGFSTPPGMRTRASAPSSARCSRSVPGQASPPARGETPPAERGEGAESGMAASIPTGPVLAAGPRL
ncbi:hypothetical protein SMICM17S_10647 [Streptomyces microflavus]